MRIALLATIGVLACSSPEEQSEATDSIALEETSVDSSVTDSIAGDSAPSEGSTDAPAMATRCNAAMTLPPNPGGFLEPASSTTVRPRKLPTLPAAGGKFTFPAPYNTEAIRLTDDKTCGGKDCVNYVGYSYWRNTNSHEASDKMLVFLGLNSDRGGSGLTLFEIDKATFAVKNLGPIFAGTAVNPNLTGEGLYFSGSKPTVLYYGAPTSKLNRIDVLTKKIEVVFDTTTKFPDTYVWQHHSSDDDRVHSFTLRKNVTYEELGCAVYREDKKEFTFFAKKGEFDECQIDRSGRWLVIKENVDGKPAEDNRIIDLETNKERTLLDPDGAGGHSDMGYGTLIAADNYNAKPNAYRLWNLASDPLDGPIMYHDTKWWPIAGEHVSHTNACPGAPEKQFVCDSRMDDGTSPRGSEIFCYLLDGKERVLVVAPVMTDPMAAGGGDAYGKMPKGNLDVTGRFFIWTTNLGGARIDAFIVRVPSHLLYTP
jgi:hypothetical protein